VAWINVAVRRIRLILHLSRIGTIGLARVIELLGVTRW